MNLERQLVWILATAIGYGALVVPIVRRGRSKFTRTLLALYALLSMLWAWSREVSIWQTILSPWSTIVHVGVTYVTIVQATLLGMLTTMYLRQPPKRAWLWTVGGGTTILAMAILDLAGIEWPVWSALSSLNLSQAASAIGRVTLSGGAYLASWNSYGKIRRPLHRNRLRYWILILTLVFSGECLFSLFGFPLDELGGAFHWSGTALACIAVLSHHLPDLSSISRQALRYVLLTLLTALVFVGGIYLAQYATLLFWDTRRAVISAVGVGLLLAILYPPLRRWMRVPLNRLLFGRGYDRERILREYSQSISNILDLDVLIEVAVGTISEAMRVGRGALLVCEECFRPNGLKLRPVRGVGALDVEPILVDSDSPFVTYMVETGVPLSQYDLDLLPRFQGIAPDERSWFGDLEMDVYVPILAQRQLLGILVLGAKTSGDPYTPADNALLRTLAGQTAIALKNARLVADLKRLNAEITQLNRDLTETNERLAILDKAKSDFISIASHELKTPLTQIRGYTDMLLEMSQGNAVSSTSVERLTQRIAKGSQRLHSVVDALLDVSLIEADAFDIHSVPVSLQYVIKQVIGGLGAAIQERRQVVTTAGLDDLPEILADEARLHQAFRNILTNAIKFTPDEGQINVRAYVLPDGKEVEISVADTGIGIDPEHQDLIFEKFYRQGDLNLHSTGQTKFKGAGPGLGLPIARGLVEAHGGRIWVESDGHDEETCPGSTFHVVLPVDGPSQ